MTYSHYWLQLLLVPQSTDQCRVTDMALFPTAKVRSPRSGAVAERSCPTSKVKSSSCALLEQHEEIPHVQGKRNPSEMVGTERGYQRETHWNHNHRQLANLITRTTALSNSMKPSHACGATQDGRVMVERSDRIWSTGEGNGKPLQYSCLENPMNSMKRQNGRILKEELPSSVSNSININKY